MARAIAPEGVEIARASTPADFEAAAALIDDMAHWDAREAEAFGIPATEVIAAFYGLGAADLARRYGGPGSALFLARVDGRPAGTVAYAPLGDGTAELEKLWIAPEFRGQGLAARLLAALLDALGSEPYDRVRLETATFMASAIRLYEAWGFVRTRPFRPPPPSAGEVEVFMERRLTGQPSQK